MKKIAAIVIALVMCVSLLSACNSTEPAGASGGPAKDESGGTSQPSAASSGSGTQTNGKEPIEFDFAFVCWGYSDQLSLGYQSSLLAISEGLMTLDQPIKINWDWEACSQDENLDVCESMCKKGMDAVICIRLTTALVDMFNANETYFGCYTVFSDEVEEYAMQSPYWLGTIHEMNAQAAYDGLQYLLEDEGCQEIVMMGPAPGNEQHDVLWDIWYELLDEYPDVVTHEYKGEDRNEAMKNFISLYPNIDGVIDTAGSAGYGDATVSAIISEGKTGEIVYSTRALPDCSEDAFAQGIIVHTADGTQHSPCAIFIMLLNKLMGTPLSDKPEIIDWPYMYIRSSEDYANYYKYCYDENVPMITFDEYEPYFKWLHSDASFEKLSDFCSTLTLDGIIERHETLIG